MTIDIKTANIEPVRLTFDHLEARIGKGKSATRYLYGAEGLARSPLFRRL